ncbi:DUF2798 domain-containing protein [Neobacillus mesonae]|nr:DUF2798 domain-containing protein [Neobacillus mesonae]
MPSNKKEGIIFGLFMCFGMVLIMSLYNTALTGFSSFKVEAFAIQFIITFIVAFIVESIVGPTARKMALSVPYDKSKPINSIIAIALCMVPMMVLIMSVYGLILKSLMVGIEGPIITTYLKALGLNIIVALPAQLLIVGPISRFLLTKFVKPSAQLQPE